MFLEQNILHACLVSWAKHLWALWPPWELMNLHIYYEWGQVARLWTQSVPLERLRWLPNRLFRMEEGFFLFFLEQNRNYVKSPLKTKTWLDLDGFSWHTTWKNTNLNFKGGRGKRFKNYITNFSEIFFCSQGTLAWHWLVFICI